MIIFRIASGISEHFPARVSEWIMTGAILGWSMVLGADSATFATSNSFSVIERYGSESSWALLCLAVAMARLVALVVNGTFKGFRYSPHLRGIASFIACVFWGQIALGVCVAWYIVGGAGTGVIAYSTFMLIETWNLFRAWADVGASRKVR